MKRIKTAMLVAMVAMMSVFGALITVNSVHAITVNDLKDRFVARGFEKCYKGHNNGQYIMTGDKLFPNHVFGWKTLIPNDGEIVGLSPEYASSDQLTCAELFTDYAKISVTEYSSNDTPDATKVTPVLNALGFKPAESSDKRECEDFNFSTEDENTKSISTDQSKIIKLQVCSDVSKNGTMNSHMYQSPAITKLNDSGATLSFEVTDQSVNGRDALALRWSNQNDLFKLSPEVTYVPGSTKWSDFVSKLASALNNWKIGSYSDDNSCAGLCGYYFLNHNSVNSNESSATEYQIDRDYYKTAYERTGKSYPSPLTFTKQEQAALYQDYLVSYYGMETAEGSCSSSGSPINKDGVLDTNTWQTAKVYDADGKLKRCYVRFTNHTSDEVYGLKALVPAMVDDGKIGLSDIIKWLNDNGPDSIPSDLASSIGQPAESETEKTEDDNPSTTCFDGGGALGWVLCPLLEGASWAVNQIYSGFIEPSLTINANLLAVNDNNDTNDQSAYDVWQIFQTFANIAFAIMILVVIISQLTGVGIDNYGIKRILPRLIISALLINLSFIICQLAVDLSNILGVSLKNLFDSLGPSAVISGGTATGNTAAWVTIIVSVVAVGGAFLALGLGVIIPILVAALSALIAVFFLFLVLAARQAAIVILVVISPLALVMYMLPNTKKYFDKFVKIFATLLIVYPICGLVMGGGNFASRVLLVAGGASADSFSADGSGFFYQISAVLVSIVPFFFIPSLVKNSLAGLGNIGAKISGIGSKVSGRATKTSRGALEKTRLGDPSRFSRWSKVRQAERVGEKERRSALRRAQARVNKYSKRDSESLSPLDRRRFATAQATVDKLEDEEFAADTSLAMMQYGNSSESEIKNAWNKAFDTGNKSQLSALTSVMESRFGSAAAKMIGSELSKKKGIDSDKNYQDSLEALQTYANKNGKFAGALKDKALDAHSMITSGGRDEKGEFQDLEHFTKQIPELATKASDWQNFSAATFKRAEAAGVLATPKGQAMMQQLRDSESPAIRDGIMSDAEIRAIVMRNAGPSPSAGGSTTPPPTPGPTGPTGPAPTPTGPTPTGRPKNGSSGGTGNNPLGGSSAPNPNSLNPEGSEFKIDHSNQNSPDRNGSNNSDTFSGSDDYNDYYNNGGNLE
ncbi:hypothetical protein IJH02_01160 [Candidatus Saccharibacteria bacterium]|nr:hypothetical protein [Candidatus Saccharibacteria bacterium]